MRPDFCGNSVSCGEFRLWKYSGLFALIVSVGTLAQVVLFYILNIRSEIWMTIVLVFAAANAVAGAFVSKHRRIPTKTERRHLTLGSIVASYVASWLLPLIIGGTHMLMKMGEMLEPNRLGFIGTLFVMWTIIFYIALSLTYWLASAIFARLQRPVFQGENGAS